MEQSQHKKLLQFGQKRHVSALADPLLFWFSTQGTIHNIKMFNYIDKTLGPEKWLRFFKRALRLTYCFSSNISLVLRKEE
jgi:hypothetical protein